MRVLLAPGPFGDAVPAAAAAAALARGWRAAAPADLLDLAPLPEDGGLAPARLEGVDLVVTGEEVFDAASLLGATGAVAAAAQAAGLPCLVVAARLQVGRREAAARGVDEARALEGAPGAAAPAGALADALTAALADAAARLARSWSG